MKHLVIALLLLIHFSSFSQSVNDYQYVIVPEQYEFAKHIDEYQLNSLTKFLFNKYGFDAYKARDEKPVGFTKGNCNTLYANVESESNFLVARFKVVLTDCRGNIVFVSEQGKSKDKDFKRAYHEALRKAFLSIEELQYAYNGKVQENTEVKTVEAPETPKAPETPEVEEVIPQKETIVKQVEETIASKVEEVVTPNLDGTYKSADGSYKIIVAGDNLTIYEGAIKIGTAITNDTKNYEVLTTQFNGKGRFDDSNFIVDRVVKGVGVVQMIFSKN